MIETIKINTTTERFINEIKSIMRAKGYKLTASKHSAEIEYSFIKPGKVIAICGWHGDGRYGKLRLIMSLYAGMDRIDTDLVPMFTMPDNKPDSYGAGLPRDARNDQIDEDEYLTYLQNIDNAKKWIVENA